MRTWLNWMLICGLLLAPAAARETHASSSETAFAGLQFGDDGHTVLKKIRTNASKGVFECTVENCDYTNAAYENVVVELEGIDYQVYWTLRDDKLWEIMIRSYALTPSASEGLKSDWSRVVDLIRSKHGEATAGPRFFPTDLYQKTGMWTPTHVWELPGKRIDLGAHCRPSSLRQGYQCDSWVRIVDPSVDSIVASELAEDVAPAGVAPASASLF